MAKQNKRYIANILPGIGVMISVKHRHNGTAIVRGYAVHSDTMIRVDKSGRHQRKANSEGQIDTAIRYVCSAIIKEQRNSQLPTHKDEHNTLIDAPYSAALQNCDLEDLCDPNWAQSTTRNAKNYFIRQIIPRLDQIGLEIEETDLIEIKEDLVAKALRNGRSNRDPAQAEQSVNKYLCQANMIYHNLQIRNPHLPPLEFVLTVRSTVSPEQAKAIPDPTRVRLAVLLTRLCATSGLALAVAMMLLCGLRTAEAAAVLIGDIVLREGYIVYPVLHQIQNGERIPILKSVAAYRIVVGPYFLKSLLEMRIAYLLECGINAEEIAKMPLTADPNSDPDQYAAPNKLSKYAKSLLLSAGYTADAILAAEALQSVEPDLDADRRPNKDVTAYILRRDWATRACNICGLTPTDVDYLMGHVYDRKQLNQDYTAPQTQEALAQKLENYIFLPNYSLNPAVYPLALDSNMHVDLPECAVCALKNTSTDPLRITIEVTSREPGETILVTSPDRSTKLTRKHSLSDPPEQRQVRVPIGVVHPKAYYNQLIDEANQIKIDKN